MKKEFKTENGLTVLREEIIWQGLDGTWRREPALEPGEIWLETFAGSFIVKVFSTTAPTNPNFYVD